MDRFESLSGFSRTESFVLNISAVVDPLLQFYKLACIIEVVYAILLGTDRPHG